MGKCLCYKVDIGCCEVNFLFRLGWLLLLYEEVEFFGILNFIKLIKKRFLVDYYLVLLI